ncbi:hypothetical protein FS837_012787 [Tulasnella sp. UAMH 9824]|nr:hypothetical protein FS837_012787 [Tulasnella sp. UAMH 9824]
MGCCFSKPDDEILKDDGPTEPKQATDAASPEPNISTEIVTDQATATEDYPKLSVQLVQPMALGPRPILAVTNFTGQLTERTKSMFQGSFSDVSQAKVRGLVVAVKAFRVTDIEGAESRIGQQLAAELYAWTKLEHPNVLRPLGFAIEDGIPCLISPWCGNGTLQKYLQKLPDTNRRRRLVREIAEGVKHLHEQKPAIIHGDLKPLRYATLESPDLSNSSGRA